MRENDPWTPAASPPGAFSGESMVARWRMLTSTAAAILIAAGAASIPIANAQVQFAGNEFQIKYKDKSPEGLRKLSISDKGSSSPGRVDVVAKAFTPGFNQIPLGPHFNATVVLGDPTIGECGETAFLASECSSKLFSFAHDKTTCRR